MEDTALRHAGLTWLKRDPPLIRLQTELVVKRFASVIFLLLGSPKLKHVDTLSSDEPVSDDTKLVAPRDFGGGFALSLE